LQLTDLTLFKKEAKAESRRKAPGSQGHRMFLHPLLIGLLTVILSPDALRLSPFLFPALH
jgi:hypothetical protein